MEPLSILLVDDDADIGTLMKMKLAREASEMTFHFVEGGVQCLEYLKDNKVDCILSDYQMPDMDGMELLLELRSRGNKIPFIFLTGQGNEEVARDAFKNGAYDYFTKDIGFAHFARIINSVVQAVRHRHAESSKQMADESLLLFRNLLDRTSEAIFVTDPPTGRFLFVNDKACSSLGYDRGKLLTLRARDIESNFQDQASWDAHVDELKAKGHLIFEGKQMRSEGASFPVEVNVTYTTIGEKDYMVAVVHDITKRKLYEHNLQEAEVRYRTVFDQSPDGILIMDDKGNFIEFNEAAHSQLGYSREEFAKLGIADIDPVESPEEIQGSLDCLLDKGKAEFDVRHITKDGEVRDVHVITQVMVLSGQTVFHTIWRDITEHKRAEEVLATSLRLQKAILDNVPFMAWLKDVEGRFIAVNEVLANAIGLRPGDIIGKTEYDFFDREFADKCGETDSETIKSGKRSLFEEPHITKDGNTVVIDTIKTPVFNDAGVIIGLTGIARDITEKKELDRQRADFYAMVTHDIKSPLTAILGNVDMLTEMPEMQGKRVAPIVDSISSSCGKLVGLFEDFIAISRIEAGNLNLLPYPHDINSVIKEVLLGLGKAAQAKGIVMKMHGPEAMTSLVLMDQKLIHRAVYNLVQNAVNYTAAGGAVTVGVDRRAWDGKDFIVFSVADTGRGIPPEEQNKVFGKYYRSSSNRDIKGTGLGLFIVKSAAEAHGGRVELESEVGKGSTFRLILPVN